MQQTDHTPQMGSTYSEAASIRELLEQIYREESQCHQLPLYTNAGLGFLDEKLVLMAYNEVREIPLTVDNLIALGKAAWDTDDLDLIESQWNITPKGKLCDELYNALRVKKMNLMLRNYGSRHEEIYGFVSSHTPLQEQDKFREVLVDAVYRSGLFEKQTGDFGSTHSGYTWESFTFANRPDMRLLKTMKFHYGLNNGISHFTFTFGRTIQGRPNAELNSIRPEVAWSTDGNEDIAGFTDRMIKACADFFYRSERQIKLAVRRRMNEAALAVFLLRLQIPEPVKKQLSRAVIQVQTQEGRNEFTLVKAMSLLASFVYKSEPDLAALLRYGASELLRTSLQELLDRPVSDLGEEFGFCPALLGPPKE
jgi:hypothetical protein